MKRLIIGPAWVGDMVMAQALARRLRRLDPAGSVHMMAPAATFPLIAHMPEIDRGWLLDIAHGRLQLHKRWQLAGSLRSERFDEAIILPRSFKSALAPFLAGIPRRVGMIGEMRYGLINIALPAASANRRTVDEFVRFAGASDLAEDERPRLRAGHEAAASLARLDLHNDRKLVVLCPGAEYGPAKRWPAYHFAGLAGLLAKRGIASIIVGGAKERALGQEITAGLEPGLVHDLTGQTTLGEVIGLLARADVVVSNDSGLMHIAAALDRPLIALFGSSSPERTPPLSPHAQILSTDISCRPCFKRDCPLGHADCLVKLDVARVAAAVWDRLA